MHYKFQHAALLRALTSACHAGTRSPQTLRFLLRAGTNFSLSGYFMLSFQADFVPSDTKHPALASAALHQLYNTCSWVGGVLWSCGKETGDFHASSSAAVSLLAAEFGKSAGSLAKERGNLPWNSTPTAKHSHIQAQRWAEPA